jgi:E3 ubiquitin-protein ligase HUWE1
MQEGVLDLMFSVETDEWGVTKVVDLKEGGRHLPVTDENKREYVDLVVKHRLTDSIQEQVQAFVSGFTSIVPKELVSIFNASELQLLISGCVALLVLFALD